MFEGAVGKSAILTVALLATGLCLAAPGQGGGWGAVLAPPPEATVTAGSTIEIRWDNLPEGVRELELLLTVDQAGASWVRLTEQLPPSTRSYFWQVPDLPAGHARLRLRVGLPGGAEVDGPVGSPFVIMPAADGRVVPLGWREGEWWTTRLALPASPLGHYPVGMTRVPLLLAFHERLASCRHTRPPLLSRPAPAETVCTAAATDSEPGLLHSGDRRPRTAPLRC